MVYDLFSSMDYGWGGVVYLFSWLSYFSGLLGLICLLVIFSIVSPGNIFWSKITNNVKTLQNILEIRLLVLIFICLICFLNLWGLNSFIFPNTTQFLFIFHLAFLVWLGLIFSNVSYNYLKLVSNFVPLGANLGLGGFISIVEVISNLIRPFTLCLRLGINMTTGHILIGLIVSGSLGFINSILVFFILTGFYLFEIGICLIQGFVFGLLINEYYSEHNE
uniref:ATP synthase subunit a n=1 Tax=Syndesmis kurakaikina TaxID=2711315 RepID=A0A7G5XUK1_9PLAT|nr:ATP synthase subunit 6 [Syndesmis kurakaikina]